MNVGNNFERKGLSATIRSHSIVNTLYPAGKALKYTILIAFWAKCYIFNYIYYFVLNFCISMFSALQDIVGTHYRHCRMSLTPINGGVQLFHKSEIMKTLLKSITKVALQEYFSAKCLVCIFDGQKYKNFTSLNLSSLKCNGATQLLNFLNAFKMMILDCLLSSILHEPKIFTG